jgi:hypothetical protein
MRRGITCCCATNAGKRCDRTHHVDARGRLIPLDTTVGWLAGDDDDDGAV